MQKVPGGSKPTGLDHIVECGKIYTPYCKGRAQWHEPVLSPPSSRTFLSSQTETVSIKHGLPSLLPAPVPTVCSIAVGLTD